VAITGVCMMLAIAPGNSHSRAQSRKDPLTDQQIEDVREAGDQPLQRIKLFVGYVDDRAKAIHSINTDARAQNKEVRMHNLFDEFTRLSDDLQDNMDNFDQQHADLRKVLKEIVDKTGEWSTVLNEPKPSTQYDFVRKTALDANQSAHEAATQMLADEAKYFAEKKKEEKEEQKR
jgi:ABC-type transporter Mla subunit MlaD